MTPAGPAAPARVGRDGGLRLRIERRDGRSVLAGCRSVLPLQVLAPLALPDAAAVISILNPTGGLVGGDRQAIEVTVAPGAHGCLTTPSATRVYRTEGRPAEQAVHLRLGRDAVLEWVPEHTIPSAGAAFRQRIVAELDEGARLVLVDAFAAGRVARGEAWRFARLESAIEVRDAAGWLFLDRFALDGAAGGPAPWAALGLAEGHPYFATVLVAGDGDPEAFHRALGPPPAGAVVAAAPLPRRGAVVRVLAADAPSLLAAVEAAWAAGRTSWLGAPRLGLRKG